MRDVIAGARDVLGMIGGAVLCGAASYWWLSLDPSLPPPWRAVLLISAGLGCLAGGMIGVFWGRLVGAFLLGSLIGALFPPATVLGLWVLFGNSSYPDEFMAVVGTYHLFVSSPVDALVVGGLAVVIARAGSKRSGAPLLGAFIGAVLPLTSPLVEILLTPAIRPGWWIVGIRPLLLGSPIDALVVALFGLYVIHRRLKRMRAFLLGGLIGVLLTLATLLAVQFFVGFLLGATTTFWWRSARWELTTSSPTSSPVSAWIVGAFGAYVAGNRRGGHE
jgi:hypothetical protein